ncbi:unnamed protein product [Toxocara canis]|uniref:Ovule protein n=1 Tax=Toxocara canis TaxID=6265 RepID=A0A183UFY2_TOXCA|nr:unnamed protein product [Toxocara canis]
MGQGPGQGTDCRKVEDEQVLTLVVDMTKSNRSKDDIYAIPEPSMNALPSYYEIIQESSTFHIDKNSSDCYDNKQFVMKE